MPHEHLAPPGTSQDIPYAETSLIKSISHLGDLCPKDRFPLRFAPSPWHCSSPASCPVPPMPWHHRLVELRAPAQRRPREGSTAPRLGGSTARLLLARLPRPFSQPQTQRAGISPSARIPRRLSVFIWASRAVLGGARRGGGLREHSQCSPGLVGC